MPVGSRIIQPKFEAQRMSFNFRATMVLLTVCDSYVRHLSHTLVHIPLRHLLSADAIVTSQKNVTPKPFHPPALFIFNYFSHITAYLPPLSVASSSKLRLFLAESACV